MSQGPTGDNKENAVETNAASQTAQEYISSQLALEASAKEILPYKFDKCTYELGPLRQNLYSCLTCSPPPASAHQQYTPAGVCYACSISCHSDHTLVELFSHRNFTCDCGTTRFTNDAPCTLRVDENTSRKGVSKQKPGETNTYNQNFQGKFCGCGEDYDPDKENSTMYQCIGLGTVETGGCGEDWWHPECLMGLPRDWHSRRLSAAKPIRSLEAEANVNEEEAQILEEKEKEHPIPADWPDDEDFSTLICYKCVESNPWLKAYAGTPGFLAPIYHKPTTTSDATLAPTPQNLKRKASDIDDSPSSDPSKRQKEETTTPNTRPPSALLGETTTKALLEEDTTIPTSNPPTSELIGAPPSLLAQADAKTNSTPEPNPQQPKHLSLSSNPPTSPLSLLCLSTFRSSLCTCPQCYPSLRPHSYLLEEEDEYEPSLSASTVSHPGSLNSNNSKRSLYDRGEQALNTMDRVKALEGVMAYNHVRDKVKAFLRPYAESGRVVGAEDVKRYFEQLRGDAVTGAGQNGTAEGGGEGGGGGGGGGGGDGVEGDGRREQSGY